MTDFTPDPRLAEDSYPVTELPLCQLRLMDDARYPWLVLIPRRPGGVEVFDLADDDQQRLWQEAGLIGRALKETLGGDKLNIASLGNMVPQLHVHVILRRRDDAAWPGPVWGQGRAEAYDLDALARRRDRLLAMVEGIEALQPD